MMYKLIVSGTFKSGEDKIDYESVEMLMPVCDMEYVLSNIFNRVGAYYIKSDERYKDYQVSLIETAFIDDDIVQVEVDNPINGKNIKDMDWKDLQMFAVQTNILEIPLTNSMSIREAREKTIRLYYKKVLGAELRPELKYLNLPDVLSNDNLGKSSNAKVDYEKAIVMEDKTYSFDELKEMARQKGIEYHPNIGYDKLHSRIFG